MARPYPSSLPTPHSRPPQTLSSLASLLFTNTHKCVNTEPQPPSFPSFVNTPNKAVLSLERRPKRSTKHFLLVVFDMEIFKIAANKQWSITPLAAKFSLGELPLSSPPITLLHLRTVSTNQWENEKRSTASRTKTHTHCPHHHFLAFFCLFLSCLPFSIFLGDLDREKRRDGKKTRLQQNQNAF